MQRLLQLNTEAGAFGISTIDDPLTIIDLGIPHQTCSVAFMEFDDEKIAQYVDEQFMLGRQPCECTRIWIHTHPKGVSSPSGVDEDTFEKIFGKYDWSAMVIFPKDGTAYARLKIVKQFVVEAVTSVELAMEEPDIEAIITERIKTKTYAVVQSVGTQNNLHFYNSTYNHRDTHIINPTKKIQDTLAHNPLLSESERDLLRLNDTSDENDVLEETWAWKQYLAGAITYNEYLKLSPAEKKAT